MTSTADNCNTYTSEYLDRIRAAIESMPVQSQLNVLRILCRHPTCTLNENQSGTRINLRYLHTDIIDELVKYIEYTIVLEDNLSKIEDEKKRYNDMYNATHTSTGEPVN